MFISFEAYNKICDLLIERLNVSEMEAEAVAEDIFYIIRNDDKATNSPDKALADGLETFREKMLEMY